MKTNTYFEELDRIAASPAILNRSTKRIRRLSRGSSTKKAGTARS